MNKSSEQDSVSRQTSQASTAKVAPTHKRSSHWFWVIGGLIFIVFVTVVLTGHRASKHAASDVTTSNGYQDELKQNLQKLEQTETTIAPTLFKQERSSPKFSKEYLARQNAPTTVFNASPQHEEQLGHSTSDGANFSDRSRNAAFANHNSKTNVISARAILNADYTVASGEFIHAQLETAINSDLPGKLRAVVMRPVYAYVGDRLLIPAGSRLIGQYSSAVLQGQNRVMVIWNRLILPDGVAVDVNSAGTDALGRAGQSADAIETHFLERFGEASLLSVIGAGASNYGVNSEDQYNSAAQYRTAIADSFQQAAQQSLQNTLAVKPTLHVYQGQSINVFVVHDLSFYDVIRNGNVDE
ncbi:MAG: TrbI/VirB10 family protein [Gammaproteobacteria bacterium]|nr:TrbI/VirB10 family protein [Gammaproteobacteria bacterium]MBU2546278.1 TrbI/VirB10 family protein [Gammaproteobacteria bacterium]